MEDIGFGGMRLSSRDMKKWAVMKIEHEKHGKLEPSKLGPMVPWVICENGSPWTRRAASNQGTVEWQASTQNDTCVRTV